MFRIASVLTVIIGLILCESRAETPAVDQGVPLRRGLFGAALEYSFGGIKPENAELRELVGRTQLTTLRVPCGTGMNFWDWQTGLPHTRERLEAAGCNFDHHFMQWVIKGRASIPAETGPLTVDRWLDFANAIGAQSLWGVNVVTGTTEETEWFVKKLKSLNAGIAGFELGNETYLGGSRPGLKDVHAVMDRCRQHAAVIRQVYPNAKIAVPAREVAVNPYALRRLMGLKEGEVWKAPWNNALVADPFFDAVTVHFYAQPSERGDLDKVSREEIVSWAFARCSAPALKAIGDYYHDLLPGKEVWLTEWGLNHDMWRRRAWRKHGREALAMGRRHLPEHTQLDALYMADFILNLASQDSPITVATAFPLLNKIGNGMIVAGKQAEARAGLEVFGMLGPAFRQCTSIAVLPQSVPTLPQTSLFPGLDVPGVDAFAFYDDGTLRYVVAVNKLNSAVSLQLPDAAATTALSAAILTADDLLPGWGQHDNPPLPQWNPPRQRLQRSFTAGAEVVVPKWSLTVLAPQR